MNTIDDYENLIYFTIRNYTNKYKTMPNKVYLPIDSYNEFLELYASSYTYEDEDFDTRSINYLGVSVGGGQLEEVYCV